MKQSIFEILSNTALTDSVYKMVLAGDTSAITAAGQFVNIQLDGMFLRRPISVCDYDEKTLTIVYKVVGKGTEAMSAMTAGKKLECDNGLFNVLQGIKHNRPVTGKGNNACFAFTCNKSAFLTFTVSSEVIHTGKVEVGIPDLMFA